MLNMADPLGRNSWHGAAVAQILPHRVTVLAHFIHEPVRDELMGGDEAVGLA
jgi:hypothetical protein